MFPDGMNTVTRKILESIRDADLDLMTIQQAEMVDREVSRVTAERDALATACRESLVAHSGNWVYDANGKDKREVDCDCDGCMAIRAILKSQ